MLTQTILDVVLTALVTSGLVALLWARLNRLEAGHEALRAEIAGVRERMATREDLAAIRGDMSDMRGELSGIREEMGVMRSDLTHVALAVGANRPRPLEGSGETPPEH